MSKTILFILLAVGAFGWWHWMAESKEDPTITGRVKCAAIQARHQANLDAVSQGKPLPYPEIEGQK